MSYRRGWQLLEGAASPFFTDALSAGMSGTLSHRTSAAMNASYLSGELQGQARGLRGQAYTGTGWLTVALNRSLTLFGQYTYYGQQFHTGLSGLDLPLEVDRNNVRAGLVLRLPPGR